MVIVLLQSLTVAKFRLAGLSVSILPWKRLGVFIITCLLERLHADILPLSRSREKVSLCLNMALSENLAGAPNKFSALYSSNLLREYCLLRMFSPHNQKRFPDQ